MEIKVGVSARHVHLSENDFNLLFGENYRLTPFQMLSQHGEFSANETVSLVSKDGRIDQVRILGPLREYSQCELTKTDAYRLKIDPPVRNSGDVENGAAIIIEGPHGTINRNCCIIATRHIHLRPESAQKYNLKQGEIVSVEFDGIKKTIFKDVYIKIKSSYEDELHIDNDDSNGNLLFKGDLGIVKKMVN